MTEDDSDQDTALDSERFELLQALEDRLETSMLLLGLVWLVLLVSALRVFRVTRAVALLRATRATRGLRLVKVVGSLNRGMRALGSTMDRRGFGYVVALTCLVTLAGAAGMYAFENQNPDGRGLNDYGTALWWTAMVMTTMGSEYWPQTGEGRVLCFLLSLYAFADFGYVTATLATFFIGRDAESDERRSWGPRRSSRCARRYERSGRSFARSAAGRVSNKVKVTEARHVL